MKKLIVITAILVICVIFLISAFSDYVPMDPENMNALADALYATIEYDPVMSAIQKTMEAKVEIFADNIVSKEVVPYMEREAREDLTNELVQMVLPQLYYNKESVADIPLLSSKKFKFILSQDGEVKFRYKPSDSFHSQVCFLNDGAMTWNNQYYCEVTYTEDYLEVNEDHYLTSIAPTGNWGCCDFDVSYSDFQLGQHSRNVTLNNEYGHRIDSDDIYWQVLSEKDLLAEKEMRVTEIPDFLIIRKSSYVQKMGDKENDAKGRFVPRDELYLEVCYLNSGYLTWNKDYYCEVTGRSGAGIYPDGVTLGKDVKPGEWGCFSFRNYNPEASIGTHCPTFQLYNDLGNAIRNGNNSVCWDVY